MTIDPTKTYTATVKTTTGTFVITLLAKTAPTTVNNFVFLAHRLLQVQDLPPGDPRLHGPDRRPDRHRHGRPGYTFANENVPNVLRHRRRGHGQLRQHRHQRQPVLHPVPGGAATLDHDLTPTKGDGYSLFGKVTGLTVVEKINAEGNATASANGTPPKVTQRILSVTISTS